MEREAVRIRGYEAGDRDSLYRVCLQTADSGQDATALFRDPELPGHLYVGPYLAFEPSLAFVAEDAAGVGGYIVAALDSLAFEHRLEGSWWPWLRARYPEPSAADLERLSAAERRMLREIHHRLDAPEEVVTRFPSHLHINLIPRLQGRGAGRQLVVTLTAGLRAQASIGLHLFVGDANQRAIGFYHHVGFTELPLTGPVQRDSRGPHVFTVQFLAEP